ncbi:hypothetical protein QQF64_019452, partial [Cirrhinus molitorella]
LRGCKMTGEGCSAVTSALNSSPSHLRELDMSGNKLGNSGFKSLGDLLMNPQCKLETLHLNDCDITDVAALTQSLKETKALQFLKELDLSKNNIGYSKNQLSDVLRDTKCNLILEKEQSYLSAGVSYITGWLSWSKAQEGPVISTEQESSDEESSEDEPEGGEEAEEHAKQLNYLVTSV